MCFSPDGSCLFSGATDSLRVFGWEPDRCFDVVRVWWGRVSDLAVCNQQLVSGSAPSSLHCVLAGGRLILPPPQIGVSHQLSSVSTFVVDLKRVKRSGGSAPHGVAPDDQPAPVKKEPGGGALRRSYERPPTTCAAQRYADPAGTTPESRSDCDVIRVKQGAESERRSPDGERQSASEDEADEKLSSAEIHNAEDYKEIFQPKNAICRWSGARAAPKRRLSGFRLAQQKVNNAPFSAARTPPRMAEPFPAPPEDGESIIKPRTALPVHLQNKSLLSCQTSWWRSADS